jgi:hypothetical protein
MKNYINKASIHIGILLLVNILVRLFVYNSTNEVSKSLFVIIQLLSDIYILYIIAKFSILSSKYYLNNNYKILLCIVTVFLLPILFTILNVDEGVPFSKVMILIAKCLSTGIFEEFLCRLLIWGLLNKISYLKKHPLLSVSLSSMIFASLHLLNLTSTESAIDAVIVQILFSYIFGLLLQSILIRFKNIFLIVSIHFCVNLLGSRGHLTVKNGLESNITEMEVSYNILNTAIIFIILLSLAYGFSYYQIWKAKFFDSQY